MKDKRVDFNSLLMVANVIVAGLLVWVFPHAADSAYLDGETIVLAIVLCIQTQAALWIERRRRDPLMLLLAFDMIFFYSFRIYTLALYSFSTVFVRYDYGPEDSNQALLFILVANLFLYAGLYVVRLKKAPRIHSEGWRPAAPGRVVTLLILTIIFGYLVGSLAGSVPRFFNFITNLLAPGLVVLMALVYYSVFRHSLSNTFVRVIGVLIVVEMVAHTLWGSRSALVLFGLYCIYVALALNGTIRIRTKYVVTGIVLAPFVAVMLVAVFAISTFNRAARDGGPSLDVGQSIQNAAMSGTDLVADVNFDLLLAPVTDRIAYFDFTAEIMAHRVEYADILNLPAYLKSIVDNLLTPGFDVYDQPKISNGLAFIYRGDGTPSKAHAEESYQSDQLGIYGEFYVLFGYGSLPLLFLVAYGLKRLYVGLNNVDPFMLTMQRVVVLWTFLRTIDSFGFDWTLVETTNLLIVIYVYRFVFAATRRPRHAPEPDTAAPIVLQA